MKDMLVAVQQTKFSNFYTSSHSWYAIHLLFLNGIGFLWCQIFLKVIKY
jgi:hypothetical protein